MEGALEPIVGFRARDVADLLLKHFGTVRQISTAPKELIAQVLADFPDVAAAIILGRKISDLSTREQLVGEPVSLSDGNFCRFLVKECNDPSMERCHVIYLDGAGRFLKMEMISVGSPAKVSVNFRTLFIRAVELAAAGLIIVHNHPSGDCRASADDIKVTKEIARLATALSIQLVDHLIVGGTEVSSMKHARLI